MNQKNISDLTKRSVYLKWLSGKFSQKEIAENYKLSETSVSKIVSEKLNKRKVKL